MDLSLYTIFNAGNPVLLLKSDGPYKVCAFFDDSANNMGPIKCETFDAAVTGTDDHLDAEHVSVYPNPSLGVLNVVVGENMKVEKLTIYDLLGKIVYSSTSGNTERIPVAGGHLVQGMHILQIETEKGLISKRIYFK